MEKTLLLIDANHQTYRAYFALPTLSSPSGEPVNAVYGFTRMVRKWLIEFQPTHGAAVFDHGPPVQRLAAFPCYKADRPPAPVEMLAQLPKIREFLEALRFPIVERQGEEADDVVATLAFQGAKRGARVYIASNDKDFAQLVGPQIRWVRSERKGNVALDVSAVSERYGVPPAQMVDLLSLVGDMVDNIPGVSGVGEKTAAALLREFGDIENLLAKASVIPRPKLRDAIQASFDQLRTNRFLIALRTNLNLQLDLDGLKLRTPDLRQLTDLFEGWGFRSPWDEPEQTNLFL
ncbi:MAG: hypothetical protein NTV14_09640 [Coprothermobacterota bacterium]|nr:hypothetical protein [Coprothermobacterota bacterium]